MESLRCARCAYSVRFCPHCGTLLPARREGSSRASATTNSNTTCATPAPRSGKAGTALPQSGAAAAASVHLESDGATDWQDPSAAWRRGLPDRHVSAFEVYRLVTTTRAGRKRPACSAAGAPDGMGDTGNGGDASTPTSPPAGDGPHEDAERSVALAWLRLSPSKKRAYEAEARTWVGAVDAATATAEQPAPPPAVTPSHTDALYAAAALPAPALPASTATTCAVATAATAKKPHTVGPNSFNLFRAALRSQRRLPMTEVAALWRAMTPAEKAPYDAAAARLRTEAMLAHGRQAPSAEGVGN